MERINRTRISNLNEYNNNLENKYTIRIDERNGRKDMPSPGVRWWYMHGFQYSDTVRITARKNNNGSV